MDLCFYCRRLAKHRGRREHFFFCVPPLWFFSYLPVEIDASRRGLAYLSKHVPSTFNKAGARQVLVAAALTYVAAALVSALQLLYLISNSRNRD